MRTRLAAATAATAAALLALTACSSSGTDDATTSPSSTAPSSTAPAASASATSTAGTAGAAPTGKVVPGLPPEPTGTARMAYLIALKAIAPSIVANPDKAVDAGRNQCTILDNGGRDPDHSAAQRFGNAAHPLTDAQGKEINAALRLLLCPKG